MSCAPWRSRRAWSTRRSARSTTSGLACDWSCAESFAERYVALMRRLITLTAAVALLLVAVPAMAKDTVFVTPSKKIACRIYDEGQGLVIRCDLYFLNDRAVRMTRRGRAHLIHVTDAIGDPKASVLAYGKTK